MQQHRKKALIVDDEETVRYVLAHQLDELGYDCVAVSSGQEALEQLASQAFALVMLDVRMPGMSGLETLKRFRPAHPETCVVMLSALVDAAIAAEAVKLGADDYLTKPCSPEDLTTRLQRAVDRKEMARQGKAEPSAFQETAEKPVDVSEITKDLVRQQVTLYERATSRPESGDKARQRRRWWPWPRKP